MKKEWKRFIKLFPEFHIYKNVDNLSFLTYVYGSYLFFNLFIYLILYEYFHFFYFFVKQYL